MGGGGQGVESDGLNKNGTCKLLYLSVWSPVSSAACGGSGDLALFEKLCQWQWTLSDKDSSHS